MSSPRHCPGSSMSGARYRNAISTRFAKRRMPGSSSIFSSGVRLGIRLRPLPNRAHDDVAQGVLRSRHRNHRLLAIPGRVRHARRRARASPGPARHGVRQHGWRRPHALRSAARRCDARRLEPLRPAGRRGGDLARRPTARSTRLPPFEIYEPGTWGPTSADELARDRGGWRNRGCHKGDTLEARPDVRRHGPGALHRRDRSRELGTSGTPIGIAPVTYSSGSATSLGSCRSDLAEPRSLVLSRARLYAALVAAPSHRGPSGRSGVRDPGRASGRDSTTSRAPAGSARSPRATPGTARRAVSRRPRAHSARASRPPSGWRSRAYGSAHARPRRLHALRLRRLRAGGRRLHDGRRRLGGGVARRAPAPLEPLLDLDSNRVTIEGHTDLTFSEDVADRFTAYGWHVTTVADANDLAEVERAIHAFKAEHERPTLIVMHSHIGYGTLVEDTPKAHGEPLGPDGVKAAKRFFGWPEDAQFLIPDGVVEHFAEGIGARGAEARGAWEAQFVEYRNAHPELADEIERMQRRAFPDEWDAAMPEIPADPKGVASRESSGQALNAVAQGVPWLVGGAADLAPSTKTRLTFNRAGDFSPADRGGHNFHFRVREFASAAITKASRSGSCARSGRGSSSSRTTPVVRSGSPRSSRSLSSTSSRTTRSRQRGRPDAPARRAARVAARDARAARVSALPMPTRSPQTWRYVMELRHEPAVLVLSRQALPTVDRAVLAAPDVAKGAYVLADADGRARCSPHRDRFGGEPRPGRPRRARGGGHRSARRLHALLGALRPPPRSTATPCSRPPSRHASRSSRRPRSGGRGTSATAARSSR